MDPDRAWSAAAGTLAGGALTLASAGLPPTPGDRLLVPFAVVVIVTFLASSVLGFALLTRGHGPDGRPSAPCEKGRRILRRVGWAGLGLLTAVVGSSWVV